MLDQTRHKIVMLEIIKYIYGDPQLRTILGFKGGSAAMFYYDLPRFSVDLDFNLLDIEKKELVFTKIKNFLASHWNLREAREKRFTLFFLISYEKSQRVVKIEISKRKDGSRYNLKTYMGVPAYVMKEADMAAGKLAALVTRRKLAMRDIYDTWFFFSDKWEINDTFLKEKSGMTPDLVFTRAIKIVGKVAKNRILDGLGDLLDNKQKIWAREKLVDDTLFYLRLYQDLMKKQG